MKLLYNIVLVLIFGLNFCYGQNKLLYSGNITNAKTNLPIEFVNVAVLNLDSTFVKGVVTDSLGNFQFSIENSSSDNEYILQATHICYQKQYFQIKLDAGFTHALQLLPNDFALADVEVIGIRTKVRNRLNFEYNVTDKMREESLRTSQLLENIPTVFIDYNRTVYIKGSSNILILKNGVEMADNGLMEQIPPETVQKVEIMYNVPSKYAHKNYTAVMNIITKREQGASFLVDNNLSFDGRMYDTKVNLGLETGKHSFYLFYKLYYRDFLEKSYTRTTDIKQDIDTSTNLRISPRKECDNEFFYGYSFQPNKNLQVGADGYLSLYRENNVSEHNDANYNPYARFKEKYNTQHYKTYLNYGDSINKIQGVLAYNNININDRDAYYDDGNENDQEECRETYNAQLDFQRKINPNITVTTGVEYIHSKNRGTYSDFLSDFTKKYKGNIISAYAESVFALNDYWMLDVGVNIYNYSRSFTNNTKVKSFNIYPKFNASYSWNEQSNLAVGYSSYINLPSIWKILPFTKEESPNIYGKGNPFLKPEKRSKLVMEYSYSKGDFYLSGSAYYKQVHNGIQSIANTHENFSLIEYVNLEKSYNYGIDFTLSNKLFKWWHLSIYADALYRHIPSNAYYKNYKFSYSGQVQSSWIITPKLSIIMQYIHNSSELVYNGFSKSFNSSIAMMSYSINNHLDIYLLFVQPFSKFENQSCIYHKNGYLQRNNKILTQTLLLSFTYNFNKGKKQSKKRIYQNEEKRY